MSKFKIIDGFNITSIDSKNREIRQLEADIDNNIEYTDKDLVTYAYHFARLGCAFQAQRQLNRLSLDYFDRGIYQDLFHSLLSWSITKNTPELSSDKHTKAYEYFIIVRRSLTMFLELNFDSKPAFRRFRNVLAEYVSPTDPTDTAI